MLRRHKQSIVIVGLSPSRGACRAQCCHGAARWPHGGLRAAKSCLPALLDRSIARREQVQVRGREKRQQPHKQQPEHRDEPGDQSRHDGMAATSVQDHRKLDDRSTRRQGAHRRIAEGKKNGSISPSEKMPEPASKRHRPPPQPLAAPVQSIGQSRHIVRRFPGARSRLDQFEPSALQEPFG